MATLLADWDAGSTAAFVPKMNTSARNLGLGSTTFTDPSGADPGTVSTPADLIRLGEAAVADAAFAQIVTMAQVTLPFAGLIYNLDADLGQGGIIGIKTGSDSAAGGCFLFESQETVDGKSLTLVGAVLGQEGLSPNTARARLRRRPCERCVRGCRHIRVLSPTRSCGGTGHGPLVRGVPVVAASTVVGWPGLTVPVHIHVGRLPPDIPSGTWIGVLRFDLGGQETDLALLTSRRLNGPSGFWRLTRL